MRILFANDYSEMVGGTEAYLLSLITELKKEGHEVAEYYGSTDYKESVLREKTFISFLKRIINFKHLYGFGKIVKDFRPDIIHLHNIFNELSPAILLRTGGIPVIMTIHDYQIVQAVFDSEERTGKKCSLEICPGCINCVGLKGFIYEKIKRALHKPMLEKIDLLIAPSKWCKKVIISSGQKYAIKQIYNGFSLPSKARYHGKPTLLFVGRLTKDKGIEIFLRALSSVIKVIPDLKCYIAGDGVLRKKVIKVIRKEKLSKKVKLLGSLSKEELFKYYTKSSITVVPSLWQENLPTVCIESLSIGRPVVGSKVGGVPEIITHGKNGLLVKPGDYNGISDAVTHLLSDKKLLRNFSNDTQKNIKKFRMDFHVKKIIETYAKVANYQ